MPVYEYTCSSCQHVTEVIRRAADADQPQPCESCGSKKTKREFSLFNAGGSPASDTGPCGLPMSGPAAAAAAPAPDTKTPLTFPSNPRFPKGIFR